LGATAVPSYAKAVKGAQALTPKEFSASPLSRERESSLRSSRQPQSGGVL